MPDSDLLKLAGLQDEVKEQTITEQEVKTKLELFEKLFAQGCYFCSRIVADEISDADIDSIRGSALVCSRAYDHYQKILREKGREECIRINNIFMRYHFGYWLLDRDNVAKELIKRRKRDK